MATKPETDHEKLVVDLTLGCVSNQKNNLSRIQEDIGINPIIDIGKRRFCYLLSKRGFRLREFTDYFIFEK